MRWEVSLNGVNHLPGGTEGDRHYVVVCWRRGCWDNAVFRGNEGKLILQAALGLACPSTQEAWDQPGLTIWVEK